MSILGWCSLCRGTGVMRDLCHLHGAQGVSPCVCAAGLLSSPLSYLFNLVLEAGEFPLQ